MITAMVFTLNEEIHIGRCLESLRWTDDVIVVDSFSTDATESICRARGARFVQHRFEGFGDQRMWAIENSAPRHEWILILDADECVPPELATEMLREVAAAPPGVAAFRLKRRFHMWGRWLRYSALYPSWLVRLVRKGRVRYVNRGHAETQEVDGETRSLAHDLIDENLKGTEAWYERQRRYAAREAEYEIASERATPAAERLTSTDPLARRAALKRLAARMPLRPTLYFLYSYVLRGGFLEGRDGLRFCRMRAEYQRMIVDRKREMRRAE
jgi:glycosyltransferase involved in cell wall biosynthesis